MLRLFSRRVRSTPSRPRLSPRRARRPRLESLEDRVVLSAVFDSVLGVGSDTSALLVRNNAVDAAGNTYVTGILSGTMDFDPNVVRPDGSDILAPRGDFESLVWPLSTSDAFVAKYAPDNSLVWARRMGSDFANNVSSTNEPFEQGSGIAVDGDGNVVVTGLFYGQADFGPITLTSSGNSDAFITKLDSNGTFLWAKSWGGTAQEYGTDIALDASGNVVSVGTAQVANSSGGMTATGFEVRKYSPAGSAIWSKQISNTGGSAKSVATDAAGNVYLAGGFTGTVDFNPDPKKTNNVTGAAGSGVNGYVLKLTAAGSFGWVSPFVAKTASAANSLVWIYDLAVDTTGNVIVGGKYRGQVDFNPSASIDYRLPNGGTSDGFVARLSPAGSLSWATPLGGGYVKSLAVDTSGAVYATGSFTQVFTPGYGLPAVTSQGGTDVFVARFASSGAVDWAVTFGGTAGDDCYGIAVDSAGTLSLAGVYGYGTTTDFDPDPLITHELSNTAYNDMCLLKLRRS